MNYDGKLLARAREKIDAQREKNQLEHQLRTERIYREIPAIREIDQQMRAQMTELVRLTLAKPADLSVSLDALREKNLDLQMHRAELLTEHGYPVDYLDEIVSCSSCGDTGMVKGQICDCLKKLYNRELTDQLSSLLRDGQECFESFDLSLYPDTPDPISGFSARDNMREVYNGCRKYALSFPDVSVNLLLRGPTGLGKTFLSACIARSVAEKGFSVCYESTAAALEAFERQKFSRDIQDQEAASSRVRQMLSCDLMLLDDLGTEMVTPLSLSALYTLLNTRLSRGLRTVISTNCSNDELQRRYTPQICSRLQGEFLELPFTGNDIRLLRRK